MAAATGSSAERRFVTTRFKRIKTWGQVYHVRRHNTREMECRHLEKDAPPPRLSAKRVIGGRGDMSREQTRFASFFEEMGLERGKERSGVGGVTALLY